MGIKVALRLGIWRASSRRRQNFIDGLHIQKTQSTYAIALIFLPIIQSILQKFLKIDQLFFVIISTFNMLKLLRTFSLIQV